MTYQEIIKAHLCDYKARVFPGLPDGFWISKRKETPLGYLLLPEDKYANLIKHYKADFFKSRFHLRGSREKIKLHIYFHHLNSSQAMCINFFFPLMMENQLELVTERLGFPGEKIDDATVSFEKESTIDSAHGYRPTNFDFYFKTISGKTFYFEIKYTEQEFGKAANDVEHCKKYADIYSKQLTRINPEYGNRPAFFENYQLMRNLIHVDDNAYVVFVYPKDNLGIADGAIKARSKIIQPAFRSHVLLLEWEDLFVFIYNRISNAKLNGHMEEFGGKYFI